MFVRHVEGQFIGNLYILKKQECFFFCKESTTDKYVGVSSLFEACDKSCITIDISMLGRSKTFAVATKFGWFYSHIQLIFTSLDVVNHGLCYKNSQLLFPTLNTSNYLYFFDLL